MKKSISELVMEYFKNHPLMEINHGPVVDWVEEQYFKQNNKKPRDTWRAIRKLHQEGKLIKVKKGIYKYDPNLVKDNEQLFDFTDEIKKRILERDGYKCVVCGRGLKDGVDIVVDHIKPKDKGGLNTLENGQTLCTEHNLLKKNYSQTEMGKKYFIKIYEKALRDNYEKMINFCKSVFDIYDKFQVNGHIKRPNGNS